MLVIISAPSGAGKTTLCESLLKADPRLTRAVTCTTRAPRPGEVDGQDYYFLSADDFLKRVQAGEFLEHATVHGASYGVLRSKALGQLQEGRDVILNIDVQGHASIRKQAASEPELAAAMISVFVVTSTISELENRLRNRATDSNDIIERRLAASRREIASWPTFDYLIVSQSREEDLRRAQVIIEAERMRHSRVDASAFES